MSVHASSPVWLHSKATGSTLLVALALADRSDDEGISYPSVAWIATKSRTSDRTVQYAIRELITLGELCIERGAGPKGCNVFRLQLQNLRGADSAGVQPSVKGGATGCTQYVRDTLIEKKESASARKSAITFNSETGAFDGIPAERIALWKTAHPNTAVDTEVLRAACWLLANPGQHKRNYERFLANWLSRAGDRPAAQQAARQAAPATTAAPRQQTPWEKRQAHRDSWAEGIMRPNREAAALAKQETERNANVIDVDADFI